MDWETLIAHDEAAKAMQRSNTHNRRAKKKNKRAEAKLVNQILAELKQMGSHAIRINSGAVQTKQGHWFRGAPTGTSDIIGILPDGRFLAIEVKTGRNKPTEKQQQFIDKVNRLGGVGFTAWSLDDVKERLQ